MKIKLGTVGGWSCGGSTGFAGRGLWFHALDGYRMRAFEPRRAGNATVPAVATHVTRAARAMRAR
jgi:hypothetical protein